MTSVKNSIIELSKQKNVEMAVRAVSFCEVLKSQQVVFCVQSTAQRYNFFD
jgi:hypothetical protein